MFSRTGKNPSQSFTETYGKPGHRVARARRYRGVLMDVCLPGRLVRPAVGPGPCPVATSCRAAAPSGTGGDGAGVRRRPRGRADRGCCSRRTACSPASLSVSRPRRRTRRPSARARPPPSRPGMSPARLITHNPFASAWIFLQYKLFAKIRGSPAFREA